MKRISSYRYKKPIKSRFLVTFFFFTLCFILLIARLFFLQVTKHKYYDDIAENNRTIAVTIPPTRGLIFDRNLTNLVMNVPGYSVYAVPRYMNDKNRTAAEIGEILNIDKKTVFDKIDNDKMFVWIARELRDNEIRDIKSAQFDGIGFLPVSKRVYPHGSLAAHILGFVDIDNNGLEGIERYYDKELSGVSGYEMAVVDAKRRQVGSIANHCMLPRNGYNFVLTIDNTIQHIAEKAMLAGVKKYHPKSASIVVMDPSNGEILALCNWPTYDLNDCVNSSADVRRNRAITDILEPGSSFKIVTASAVLEEHLVGPEDEFYCENGSYRIAGRLLHDHRPHGTLKFKNIIELSSNIGTVKVAEKLGEKNLYKYIKVFGFGEETGIDLPGEAKGILRNVSQWSKGSIAAIPIGHEIAVTAIQLTAAISCIANDGILVKPKIVQKVVDDNNALIKEFKANPLRRVISKEACLKMKEILRMVAESGTGKKASVAGYSVAGKTGTGQRIENNGSYSHSKFNSIFIGFAPVDNPKIAITIVFIEPHPHYYGGTVPAPVFADIAGKTLRYMGVPPKGDVL